MDQELTMQYIHFIISFTFILGGAIVILSMLHNYAIPEDLSSMQTSIMFSSMTFLSLIGYYIVLEFIRACTPSRWGMRRPHYRHMDYSDMDHGVDTEIVHGRPRLHIQDVWILVYGVGSSYFVCNYVLVCQSSTSIIFFSWGLTFVVCHEIVTSSLEVCTWANVAYFVTAIVAFLGGLMHSAQIEFRDILNPVMSSDWFHACFGIILPFFMTFMLIAVRYHQKFTLGGVYELCEFGIPFASIVSMLICSCMYQVQGVDQRLIGDYMDHRLWLTVLLSPIPLIIIIVFIMEAVIKNHVVDVLVSLTIAWGSSNLIKRSYQIYSATDNGDLVALFLGVVAFSMRVGMLAYCSKGDNISLHASIQQRQRSSGESLPPQTRQLNPLDPCQTDMEDEEI